MIRRSFLLTGARGAAARAAHGSFEWVKADVSEDGRFVTWSAGGRAAGPRLAAPDGRLRKRAEEWLAAEQAEAEPEGARAGDQPRKRQRVGDFQCM